MGTTVSTKSFQVLDSGSKRVTVKQYKILNVVFGLFSVCKFENSETVGWYYCYILKNFCHGILKQGILTEINTWGYRSPTLWSVLRISNSQLRIFMWRNIESGLFQHNSVVLALRKMRFISWNKLPQLIYLSVEKMS